VPPKVPTNTSDLETFVASQMSSHWEARLAEFLSALTELAKVLTQAVIEERCKNAKGR
jgi:hypothetical protein